VPGPARSLYGAVEGGGSKFLCAVGRSHGDLLAEARFATRDPTSTVQAVAAFFAPYAEQLRALGVCTFGPLELDPARGSAYGSLLDTPKPGWSNFPLHAELARAIPVRVAIDTDVNGAALAEQRWGALSGSDPAVYVTIGTGVGVGVVIDGRPLHGLMHPELGHMRARDPERRGVCPFHGGCVEGLISVPALRARTGEAPENLADEHPIWSSVADTLGELLSTIVLAYSPRRIVVAGGVLARTPLLALARRAVVRELGAYIPRAELREPLIESFITGPGLGQRSGLAGAFAIAEDLR
jgi:fructokinase